MSELQSAIAIVKQKLANADRRNAGFQGFSIAEMEAIWGVLAKAESEQADLQQKLSDTENNEIEARCHIAELQQKLDVLGHENGMMAGLLNDIYRYHEECSHDDQMHAIIPLEYVSAINDFVGRDVNGENPCPLTDAFINSVRAEGVYFAANRILAAWENGFVDDTPTRAHDISGAVLSALEFLPNASPEEFKRDYADEVRTAIAAQLRAGQEAK